MSHVFLLVLEIEVVVEAVETVGNSERSLRRVFQAIVEKWENMQFVFPLFHNRGSFHSFHPSTGVARCWPTRPLAIGYCGFGLSHFAASCFVPGRLRLLVRRLYEPRHGWSGAGIGTYLSLALVRGSAFAGTGLCGSSRCSKSFPR